MKKVKKENEAFFSRAHHCSAPGVGLLTLELEMTLPNGGILKARWVRGGE